MYVENAPKADAGIFELGVPVLGICYGHQFMCQTLGGKVSSANIREYGKTAIELDVKTPLFANLIEQNICWMSHTDFVAEPPGGFELLAVTGDCPVAAVGNAEKKFYGVQFHPEVEHTPFGKKMIANFLFEICQLKGDWSMKSFVERKVAEIKAKAGDKKVLCALSGGVDSSVAAVLVHKAIDWQTAHLHLCGPRSVT